MADHSDAATRRNRIPGEGLRVLVTFVLFATRAAAAPHGLTYEAETPFRGDEVDDRGKDFGGDYFLDVFSYRASYRWEEAWRQGQTKYRGIAGSVSSDEFWTDGRLHFHYPLAEWLHFRSFVKQVEDFDSRYRRFELAVDVDPLPFLRLGVFGEVLPEKGDDDFGMRVTLRRLLDHQITFAVEFPDVHMNTKGGDLNKRYERQPRSFTMDVRGRPLPWVTWDWGIRENFPLTLEDRSRAREEFVEFDYEQFSTYGRISIEASRRWNVLVYWGLEQTDKAHRPLDGSIVERRDLERRVYQGRTEVRYRWDDELTPYGGFRYFRYADLRTFSERGGTENDRLHREYLLYGGVEYCVSPGVLIRPEFIAGHVDRVVRRAVPSVTTDKDNGFVGKLVLPLELVISRRAQVAALVSYDLDDTKFGGGSLGFQMAF